MTKWETFDYWTDIVLALGGVALCIYAVVQCVRDAPLNRVVWWGVAAAFSAQSSATLAHARRKLEAKVNALQAQQ